MRTILELKDYPEIYAKIKKKIEPEEIIEE